MALHPASPTEALEQIESCPYQIKPYYVHLGDVMKKPAIAGTILFSETVMYLSWA